MKLVTIRNTVKKDFQKRCVARIKSRVTSSVQESQDFYAVETCFVLIELHHDHQQQAFGSSIKFACNNSLRHALL